VLALTFFFIALIYSSVGFGGGSSYLAILALTDIRYLLMPKVALICNLLVVTGGCYHFYKQKHFNKQLILPFVLSSVPMAFLGGMYPIKEKVFLILLTSSLLLAGLRLLFVTRFVDQEARPPSLLTSSLVGSALGLLSGLVGLGGGIFLSPLMLNLRWGRPKEVAAAASAFIFLNSLAGLAGQLTKGMSEEIFSHWPLFIAVILGGQIGSRLGTHPIVSQRNMQRATAVLILAVSARLLLRFF
jgi:uncharacterized membrane protein YfcA